MSLGCKVALISQQGIEVNHILINEHARDATSKLLTEEILNDAINSVTNEGLSILRVGIVTKICRVNLRKREQGNSGIGDLRNRLGLGNWSSTRVALVLLVSVATTSLATSATTIVTPIVLVTALGSTLALLVVLLDSLSLRSLLVLRLLVLSERTEKSIDELFCLSVLTLLSFLFFFFLTNPHLNADGL